MLKKQVLDYKVEKVDAVNVFVYENHSYVWDEIVDGLTVRRRTDLSVTKILNKGKTFNNPGIQAAAEYGTRFHEDLNNDFFDLLEDGLKRLQGYEVYKKTKFDGIIDDICEQVACTSNYSRYPGAPECTLIDNECDLFHRANWEFNKPRVVKLTSNSGREFYVGFSPDICYVSDSITSIS